MLAPNDTCIRALAGSLKQTVLLITWTLDWLGLLSDTVSRDLPFRWTTAYTDIGSSSMG